MLNTNASKHLKGTKTSVGWLWAGCYSMQIAFSNISSHQDSSTPVEFSHFQVVWVWQVSPLPLPAFEQSADIRSPVTHHPCCNAAPPFSLSLYTRPPLCQCCIGFMQSIHFLNLYVIILNLYFHWVHTLAWFMFHSFGQPTCSQVPQPTCESGLGVQYPKKWEILK